MCCPHKLVPDELVLKFEQHQRRRSKRTKHEAIKSTLNIACTFSKGISILIQVSWHIETSSTLAFDIGRQLSISTNLVYMPMLFYHV
jgi:hypothetical protein